MDVFGYEFPGYGMSTGPDGPSEQGCYAAIDAAHRFLTQEYGIDSTRIVLYGRSLGTGKHVSYA